MLLVCCVVHCRFKGMLEARYSLSFILLCTRHENGVSTLFPVSVSSYIALCDNF
jgi:hypothetical protein